MENSSFTLIVIVEREIGWQRCVASGDGKCNNIKQYLTSAVWMCNCNRCYTSVGPFFHSLSLSPSLSFSLQKILRNHIAARAVAMNAITIVDMRFELRLTINLSSVFKFELIIRGRTYSQTSCFQVLIDNAPRTHNKFYESHLFLFCFVCIAYRRKSNYCTQYLHRYTIPRFHNHI